MLNIDLQTGKLKSVFDFFGLERFDFTAFEGERLSVEGCTSEECAHEGRGSIELTEHIIKRLTHPHAEEHCGANVILDPTSNTGLQDTLFFKFSTLADRLMSYMRRPGSFLDEYFEWLPVWDDLWGSSFRSDMPGVTHEEAFLSTVRSHITAHRSAFTELFFTSLKDAHADITREASRLPFFRGSVIGEFIKSGSDEMMYVQRVQGQLSKGFSSSLAGLFGPSEIPGFVILPKRALTFKPGSQFGRALRGLTGDAVTGHLTGEFFFNGQQLREPVPASVFASLPDDVKEVAVTLVQQMPLSQALVLAREI